VAKQQEIESGSHGADVKLSAIKYNIDENNIIDFSSNVNVIKNNINFSEVATKISEKIDKYPDIRYKDLRENLGKILEVQSEAIIPGNGATELIYLITKIPRFKKIGIFNPTFCEYERGAKIGGKSIKELDFKLLKASEDEIDKEIENLDLLILCNPNNPTGEIADISELLKIATNRNIYIFVDETFMDFSEKENISLIEKSKTLDNIIVLKAITKFHGMPGARLGYIVCYDKELIKELWLFKEPWTVNVLAEELVGHIFNKDFEIESKKYYKIERQRLKELYKSIGLTVSESQTNYLLLKLNDGFKGTALKERLLLEKGLLIRTCNDFKGLDDSYIRIAIKKEYENNNLFESIKKICGGINAVL